MSVDHQRLNLTNRKGIFVCFLSTLVDVDSGKRSVVSKSKAFHHEPDNREQSGELMAVAETELNLKPCPVNVMNIFAADRGIGRESHSRCPPRANVDYQPYFLLQELAPCHKFKSLAFLPGSMSSLVILHFVGICKNILKN